MPTPFKAVALDYDGTLTLDGRLAPEVRDAIARARRELGVRFVLVTGRTLAHLERDCPGADELFASVVAENGAVVVSPSGRRLVAPPIGRRYLELLRARGVEAFAGEVLVGCRASAAAEAVEVAFEIGAEVQIVQNRSELMVLPSGITKATGLLEVLGDLGVSFHSTVAVGDAENDHSLLAAAEIGVAVANAVPSLRARADVVLTEPAGEGVRSFLSGPVLSGRSTVRSYRRSFLIGDPLDGPPPVIPSNRSNLLVAGATGSGKSFLAGLVLEELLAERYSVLVLDAEGDYVGYGGERGVWTHTATSASVRDREAMAHECVRALHHRFGSAVLDLSLLTAADQRLCVESTLALVDGQRAFSGLPHWIFVDEAHLFLADPAAFRQVFAPSALGTCLVTYAPEALSEQVLRRLDHVVVTGGAGGGPGLQHLARELHLDHCDLVSAQASLAPGSALLVDRDRPGELTRFTLHDRRVDHVRHLHKYVERDLPPHLQFVFHRSEDDPGGPVAANVSDLHRFLRRCAPSYVVHHARRHDFSRWLDEAVSDHELAAAVHEGERLAARGDPATAEAARTHVLKAIEHRYLGCATGDDEDPDAAEPVTSEGG